MSNELAGLDATGQAELVRKGEATPRELVDAAIARLEQVNPQLNAVIRSRFDKARAEADSPALPSGSFTGVPFLLKDLLCGYRDDEIHEGNRALARAGYKNQRDTHLAARFRAAGLICIGQTNTPEFGFSVTTEPEVYGASHNPWNPEHSTGGSSGGSGAAVSARIVPMAHANDGGGSIRIPASACGLVGLKPSRGRISLGPDYGEAWGGFINEGVVSLSVRDTARVLDAVAGFMPGDPYTAPACSGSFAEAAARAPGSLRIGLMKRWPGERDTLDPECIAAVERTGRLLESLGHVVEEAHPPAFDEAWVDPFTVVFLAHTARTAEDVAARLGREVTEEDFESATWFMMCQGRGITGSQYIGALDWLSRWQRRMARWWSDGFDLMLSPTLSKPPPRLGLLCSGAAEIDEVVRRVFALIPYTQACNVTGQPGVSLPLHWSAEGLPIGVHLIAEYGREDLLLSISAQLEKAAPWSQRLPKIHA